MNAMSEDKRLSRRTVAKTFIATYLSTFVVMAVMVLAKDGLPSGIGSGFIILPIAIVLFPCGLMGLGRDMHGMPDGIMYVCTGLCYLVYGLMFYLMLQFRKRYQFALLLLGMIVLLAFTAKGCSILGIRAVNSAGL